MRLNIGCGKVYKKGYINIDAYDNTVADEIRTATDLRFPDNSAERVEACQVIEHLGFVESNYALAEWFRVLKPRGSLLIETPDIEASIRSFPKASDQEKRDHLIWMYGIGTPGMKHGLCFPLPLLKELLERTGYADIRHAFFVAERNRPALRIICRKPEAYSSFQLIANFRKQLNKKRIIDISDETEALDLESAMDFLISRLTKRKDPMLTRMKDLVEIIVELAVFNPKIAFCFAEQFKKTGGLQAVLKKLDEIQLPRILVHLFKGMQLTPGKQEQTFQLVHGMGKEAAKKLILSKEESVLDSLSKTASEIREKNMEGEAKSFSKGSLKRLSDTLFSQGTKEFALGKYDKAGEKLANSILLFRDNILSYMNLARLMRISGDTSQAEKNYDNALKLLNVFNYRRNSETRRLIEMEKHSRQLVQEPLVSIDELK